MPCRCLNLWACIIILLTRIPNADQCSDWTSGTYSPFCMGSRAQKEVSRLRNVCGGCLTRRAVGNGAQEAKRGEIENELID
jgi:hypothetical protein